MSQGYSLDLQALVTLSVPASTAPGTPGPGSEPRALRSGHWELAPEAPVVFSPDKAELFRGMRATAELPRVFWWPGGNIVVAGLVTTAQLVTLCPVLWNGERPK